VRHQRVDVRHAGLHRPRVRGRAGRDDADGRHVQEESSLTPTNTSNHAPDGPSASNAAAFTNGRLSMLRALVLMNHAKRMRITCASCSCGNRRLGA
jgi:hypothetical protein